MRQEAMQDVNIHTNNNSKHHASVWWDPVPLNCKYKEKEKY